MSVINKLASSLGRRDEVPNQKLAEQIVKNNNKVAIQELVTNLSNKNKGVQQDCIKVLYEIGVIKPSLISKYVDIFIALLTNKNNRLQWGGMTALDSIISEKPYEIYRHLMEIIDAGNKGSVITRDHAVNILIKLGSLKAYTKKCFPLLNEQLLNSPTQQLPMYAERAISMINDNNKSIFIKTLRNRMDDLEKESGRIRIEKVIRKLSK